VKQHETLKVIILDVNGTGGLCAAFAESQDTSMG